MKQANERAQEARDALERAHEEHEVLTHAAAQHDELLEQLTALRISLSQAQAELAGKEDELLEARACLERTVRRPCPPTHVHTSYNIFFKTLASFVKTKYTYKTQHTNLSSRTARLSRANLMARAAGQVSPGAEVPYED